MTTLQPEASTPAEQIPVVTAVHKIAFLATISEKQSYGDCERYRITAHGDDRKRPIEINEGSHTRSLSRAEALALSKALANAVAALPELVP